MVCIYGHYSGITRARGGRRVKVKPENWSQFADARALTEAVLCQSRGKFADPEQRAAFARWREAVFDHAQYRCQICGLEPPRKLLEAHFIKPYEWAEGSEIDPAIGMALCRHDHRQIHQAAVNGRIGRNRLKE